MAATATVECAGCGAAQTIMAPADDGWEPILSPPGSFFEPQTVVGRQLTVRCAVCGHRTVVSREDNK